MASKALFVLTLLLAAAFLVASAYEQNQAMQEENKAQVQQWHDGGYPGRGYPGRGYPGRGGYCRWGCCGGGRYGGCRCCFRPDDIPEPMYRPEVVEIQN